MSYNPIHTKKELEQMKKEQAKPTQHPPVQPHHPDSQPHGYNPIHTKQEIEQIKHEHEKHEPEFHQPEIKISDEEYTVFIGANDDDYLPAFKQFGLNGDKFVRTWNWGAFIGGPWWFLYRKMVPWSAIYFVCTLPFFVFYPVLGLIPMIGLGMTGNYLYYKYAKNKIAAVKLMHPVRDISPELKEIGGIYKWGFYAGILGTIIMFFIIWIISLTLAGMSMLNGK